MADVAQEDAVRDEEAQDQESSDSSIDEETAEWAEMVGLDPDDYENEDDLLRAIAREGFKQINKPKSAAEDKKDDSQHSENKSAEELADLAVEAAEIDAASLEDIDPQLVARINELSKSQTDRFLKALKTVHERSSAEIKRLKEELKSASELARSSVAAEDQRRMDSWIRKSEAAKEYFGEEDTDSLDEDDRSYRRRMKLMEEAVNVAREARQNTGRVPPVSKLFERAFKRIKPSKKSKATRAARTSGASAESSTNAKPESEKDRIERAGRRAEALQEKYLGRLART